MKLRDYFKKRGGQIKDPRELIMEELQKTIGPNGRPLYDSAGQIDPDFNRVLERIINEEDTYPSHIFPQPDHVDCL